MFLVDDDDDDENDDDDDLKAESWGATAGRSGSRAAAAEAAAPLWELSWEQLLWEQLLWEELSWELSWEAGVLWEQGVTKGE